MNTLKLSPIFLEVIYKMRIMDQVEVDLLDA